MEQLLSGGDVLSIMPTGSGKSLCYQIPALALPGITLVISPLISLMQDQVRALIAMGVRAAYLNSSLTPRQMELATANAAKGIYKIIYVAPERLETPKFRQFAQNAAISLIAVDEAHCISQWGHDFRPSYTKIADFLQCLPGRPTVAAFTATATDIVRKDIIRQLRLQKPMVVVKGFDRENLFLGINKPINRMEFLLQYLSKHRDQSGIIYCGTRKTVEEVAHQLSENGFSALPYHGGMSDADRFHHQNEFIYDRTSIIVATNAFGMGIDKPNVRFVIHFQMPQNLEEYYQQAGRAGRDGEPSECLLLYSARDIKMNEFLIRKSVAQEFLSAEEQDKLIELEMEKLKLMTFYATSKTVCLRKRILSYFGEYYSPPCHRCSVCLKTEWQLTEPDRVSQTPSRNKTVNQELAPEDQALFEKLRLCRKELAIRASVPTFVVLNDATLRQLAAVKPQKLSELGNISGFGEVKIKRYGQIFLDVIAKDQKEQR